MKLPKNIGIAIFALLIAIFCFLGAWAGKDYSPKHAYVFLVAGGFMAAAFLILTVGKMDQGKRLERATISMGLGLAVILYGKTQFLSGVI